MDQFATWICSTVCQVVALLGAHTLGSMHPTNSGYAGVWVIPEANMFNNKFYQNMFDDRIRWSPNVRLCVD